MTAGRPPKFETKEELEKKIEEYFETNPRAVVSGLALHLGFESRQSFYDLEKTDKFSYIIKRARLMIENNVEEQSIDSPNAFNIFRLKNLGWKDTQDINQQVIQTTVPKFGDD